ncbi:MAG: hypothetical protein ACQGVK_08490 [Myxococcota bacterium]
MNALASKLLAIALAVLLALTGVEWALRLGAEPPPQRLEGLYVAHDRLGYALAPGFCGRDVQPDGDFDVEVCVDETGHRRSVVPDGAEGAPVLVLGGGFAFGTGVGDGETFASRLAARIDRPVVNGGLEGGDLSTALAVLDQHLEAGLVPSAVLFTVDLGRDLLDPDAPRAVEAWSAHGGRRVPRALVNDRGSLRFDPFLRLHWRSYDALRRRFDPPVDSAPGPRELGLLDLPAEGVRERLAGALRDLVARVLQTKRPILMAALAVPTRYQVEEPYRARVCAEWGVCAEGADLVRSHRLLRRAAGPLSLPFLDMLADLRALDPQTPERFYFAHDRHWKPEAHERAAAAASQLIRFIENVQQRNREAGRRLPRRAPTPPGE